MSGVYLAITDGAGTVDLSSNYWSYYPDSAPDYEEVVNERSTFRFDQSTLAATRTTIQSVGRYFMQAREWNQNRTGARVFLLFKWQSSDDAYRSELQGGQVYADPGALQSGQAGGGDSGTFLQFDIEWTRRNFWEDNTERTLPAKGFNVTGGTTQIYNTWFTAAIANEAIGTAGAGTVYAGTLLNTPVEAYLTPPTVTYTWNSAARTATVTAGTTATSGGVIAGSGIASGTINYTNGIWGITYQSAPSGTIRANYTYGYGNYINVAGTAISGDLPAPLRLEMYSSGEDISRVWVGATYGSALSFTPIYEAEAYDNHANAVGTASATASGGSVLNCSNGTAEARFIFAGFSGEEYLSNETLVPIIRFDGTAQQSGGTFTIYNTYWRYIYQQSSYVIEREQERFTYLTQIGGTVNESFLALAPTQINSYQYHPEDGTAISRSFYISGQKIESAGPGTADIDFIFFMPTKGGYSENNRIYILREGLASSFQGSVNYALRTILKYRPRRRSI